MFRYAFSNKKKSSKPFHKNLSNYVTQKKQFYLLLLLLSLKNIQTHKFNLQTNINVFRKSIGNVYGLFQVFSVWCGT